MSDKVYWHCEACEADFYQPDYESCPLCGDELKPGPFEEAPAE